MKIKTNKKGFITLFFILGISFTFLTWISLSSERVFTYIRIKEDFLKNRLILNDHILCADTFVDNFISSKYHITQGDGFIFNRSLYYSDNTECYIKNIQIYYENGSLSKVFFISGDFSFEYQFKNGFVNFVKSFNLF